MDILIHSHKTLKKLKTYYVIVPEALAIKFFSKTPLGFKMRHLYEVELLQIISFKAYYPAIKTETRLLKLRPLYQGSDYGYLKWLSLLKRPHKLLKNNLIKTQIAPVAVLNKRLSEFTDAQLYQDYKTYFKTYK